jgi:hypothetical protein
MGFRMAFIIECVIQILLELPGAIILWIFFKGEKKYSEIANDYYIQNLIISIISYTIVISLFIYFR